MGKNDNTVINKADSKRLKKIDKALRDPDLKKKARKALDEEREQILRANAKALKKAEKKQKPEPESNPYTGGETKDFGDWGTYPGEDDDDEAKRKEWLAAKKLLVAAGFPGQPSPDAIDRDNPELVAAYNLVVGALVGQLITSDQEKADRDAKLAKAETPEPDDSIRARLAEKRAKREAEELKKKGAIASIPAKVMAEAEERLAAALDEWVDPEPWYVAETEGRYSNEVADEWADDSTIANLAQLKPRTYEEYQFDKDNAAATQLGVGPLVPPKEKKAKKKAKKGEDKTIREVAAEVHAEGGKLEITSSPVTLDTEDEGTRIIADPEALQPRDRWDRPIIEPVGGGKGKGYKRTTTFIDVIDDKSALVNWGRRVVLAGVGAVEAAQNNDPIVANIAEVVGESIVTRIIEANTTLASAAKAADKALKKGKITEDEHAQAHDAAEMAHKRTLDALAAEAFKAGDGFVKAETGTRIHKLTEIYDLEGPAGLAALGDVTPSEFRDISAYAEACAALNVEILAVEQFVVVDELEVGGTLDRRLRYDSPKLGRRITAIGDVKTGRVDYGMGKMTRQLAIYAAGKGYDWRKPEERVTFRTNREVGLIFHIPAGSGICEVWEIDLKKGWEGVQLCAKIFAHRSETTQAKVGTKVASARGEEKGS